MKFDLSFPILWCSMWLLYFAISAIFFPTPEPPPRPMMTAHQIERTAELDAEVRALFATFSTPAQNRKEPQNELEICDHRPRA